MVYHRGLSDNKSPKISRTFLSILADFNRAVIWMTSNFPLISNSPNFFSSLLGNIPNTPVTIGTTVIFTFLNFFSSQLRFKYLSRFSLSFMFTQWSAGRITDRLDAHPQVTVLFFLLKLFLIFCSGLSDVCME